MNENEFEKKLKHESSQMPLGIKSFYHIHSERENIDVNLPISQKDHGNKTMCIY